MALDWDNIIIETDEYSYSLDAEQRMILFAGNKGDKGDPGDPGEAATITVGTVTTLAAGSPATVENVGTPQAARFNFGIPRGPQGDPGSGGGGAWGEITGTLSDQTDLQDALDAKADSADLGDLAEKDQAEWSTDISGIPSTFPPSTHNHDDRYYTESETDTKLDAKTNLSQVASEFSTSTAYAIDDLVIYQGALYRFIAAHSAGAWNSNHVTACSIAQVLKTFAKFEVTGTASAGSSVTITDSRINSEHWKVPKNGIWFSDSSKVTTQVHWITNVSNHTLTLEATFTGATDVKVDLDWYQ